MKLKKNCIIVKKPANGGIPAIDNKSITIEKAIIGFVFAMPDIFETFAN